MGQNQKLIALCTLILIVWPINQKKLRISCVSLNYICKRNFLDHRDPLTLVILSRSKRPDIWTSIYVCPAIVKFAFSILHQIKVVHACPGIMTCLVKIRHQSQEGIEDDKRRNRRNPRTTNLLWPSPFSYKKAKRLRWKINWNSFFKFRSSTNVVTYEYGFATESW